MIASVFMHPCGDLRAKFGNGLFFYPVVMQKPQEKCRHCSRPGGPRCMPDGDLCCIANKVGETSLTADDMRSFALQKYLHEQEIEGLAATAKAEREGM